MSIGYDGNAEPLGRRPKGKAMIALLAMPSGMSIGCDGCRFISTKEYAFAILAAKV